MITTVEPSVREAGVVYTKPWTVEIILDLAGYTSDRRLTNYVAMEPSAGDGAFLRGMVRRLVESCRKHRVPLTEATEAIQAFEINPEVAAQAVEVVRSQLTELDISASLASTLARDWIKTGDFLEASLGFPIADFVIGNPPYIRLEEIPPEKASFYRGSFETMRGRADIYVAFYQAALMQLKPGGICAYICADRWLLNDYGSALRSYITTNGFSVRYVIETHEVDAFKSTVSAYPAITIIAHEKQASVIVAKALPGIETANRDCIVDDLRNARSTAVVRAARFDSWFRGDEPWPCSSPDALKLLKEIEASCPSLENAETGTRIGIGVATGADRVFITSGNPDVEPNRLLPMAMAFDLKQGMVDWSGHYLLNPWDSEGLVDINSYPRLRTLLSAHKDVLIERHTAKKDHPDRWHKTIDRVNMSLLGREKLYIADIKDRLVPTLDVGKTYPHHNIYWITSDTWDLRVLAGLLMSDVGQFFIQCYGVRMRGGYLRFQAQYLRRIRVPIPDRLTPALKAVLRSAFEAQDVALATRAAMEAYQLESLPI